MKRKASRSPEVPADTPQTKGQTLCPLTGREAEFSALTGILSASPSSLPSSVFVFGAPQSGKSELVNAVLEGQGHNLTSAVTSCNRGAIHPKLIFEDILAQLEGHGQTRNPEKGYAAPFKIDLFAEFVAHLTSRAGEILKADKTRGLVIVLKNAEKLRELDFNLLPGFLRLRDLAGGDLNVCVILISRVTWNKYQIPSDLTPPLPFFVPQYSKTQLVNIISKVLFDSQSDGGGGYKIEEAMEHDGDDENKRPGKLSIHFFENYVTYIIGESLCILCSGTCGTNVRMAERSKAPDSREIFTLVGMSILVLS